MLRAIGLGEDLTRASLRFGIGRFNNEEEIDYAWLPLPKMSTAFGN